MAKGVEEQHAFYHVLRVTLMAFIKGTTPILAVEMGRRATPEHVRPKFSTVEKACRNKGAEAPATT